MNKLKEIAIVFVIGFGGYMGLEMLWRGHTHWTMGVTGGVCFIALYFLSLAMRGKPLTLTCLLGAAVITTIEFFSGCIVNLWLGLRVWDYSMLFGNLLGQVCILYFCLWFFLCIPVVYFSYFLQKKIISFKEQSV